MAVADRNYREDDGMYGAPYNGMPEIHGISPYRRCRELFVNLSMEKMKLKPDLQEVRWMQDQIKAFHHDVQVAAFDSVVDQNGWPQERKHELLEEKE